MLKKQKILTIHNSLTAFPTINFIYFVYEKSNYYYSLICYWPNQLGLQNTLTASLQRVKTPPNECPGYDTKQSDGEVPVKLELWRMQRTFLLPSLSGPLWPRVVAPNIVPYMGQIELNCVLIQNRNVLNRTILTLKLCTYVKLNCLK